MDPWKNYRFSSLPRSCKGCAPSLGRRIDPSASWCGPPSTTGWSVTGGTRRSFARRRQRTVVVQSFALPTSFAMRHGATVYSLDTNVLFYAINTDCAEHAACAAVVRDALESPSAWVIADQVWFELYRLLRSSTVLSRPMLAEDAARTVTWYRERSGWLHCAWTPALFAGLSSRWSQEQFPAKRTFDAVLAATLRAAGVHTFVTRNTKDFSDVGFHTVLDPMHR